MITISSKALVNLWDLKAGDSVSQFSFEFDGTFVWTYNIEESVFAVALSKEKNQVVLRLDLDNGNTELCAKLPVMIQQRRAVFPCENFVLYCNGRNLTILPYNNSVMKGVLNFDFRGNYSGLDPKLIAFSSVTMIKNSVFAVLNFGRILYW